MSLNLSSPSLSPLLSSLALVVVTSGTAAPAAAAATLPGVVVVSDGSALDAARAAAAQLNVSNRVSAELHVSPVSSTCARAPGCDDRPRADAMLLVTATPAATPAAAAAPAPAASQSWTVHMELLDARGATLAQEDVTVSDMALLAATLAPAVDRIVANGKPQARPASESGEATSTRKSDDGNGWVPWVLGIGGTCAGLCALSIAGTIALAVAQSADQAADGVGDGCSQACAAPFDGLNAGCDGFIGSVNACGDLGSSCSSGVGSCGDGVGSVGSSCGSVGSSCGSVGSCAVPLAALARPLPPDDGLDAAQRGVDDPGATAMRY